MIEKTLRELNLNKTESQTYLALLKLGKTTTGPLCKQTKIPSSKIYAILNNLESLGLVTHNIQGKTKQFTPRNPKVLFSLIEEKKTKIKAILPELLAIHHEENEQSVELYTGYKAVFALFDELIHSAKSKEDYFVFAVKEHNKDEQMNRFFRTLTLRRKEKNLNVKILKNATARKGLEKKHSKVKLKYTEFNLPQGITIFRNDVILISTSNKEPTAIRITSKSYAKEMHTFFLELWKKAKA